jgi:ABC-type phosphate transport system substrate-binding protein
MFDSIHSRHTNLTVTVRFIQYPALLQFIMSLRLSILLSIAAATSSANAEEIRIAASDLLAAFIEAPLAAYSEDNGTISFAVESIGSLPALDRLRSDEIDMAIIAVPEVDAELRQDFAVYPFAYDVAVIAVNSGNPIDEITLGRLGGIFGSNEEYNFNSWGDLGLSGWGSRTIKTLAGPADDSISLELFKHSVFKGGIMKPKVAMVKDSEVEGLLIAEPAAIAILSGLPKSDKVKTIMISEATGSPAFGPSEDNVHYGDYPIRLAFYIAFSKRDEAKLKPVLRVLFNDDVAASLRENNLFALPDTIRRKLTIDLDLEN